MTVKGDTNFEGIPTCGLENDMGALQIFTRAFENLKTENLIGSFNPKQKKYELKIDKGVICYDNEEWHKI